MATGPNLDSLFNTLHIFYQQICWTLKLCPLYAPFIISSTGTHVSCFNHLPRVDEIDSLGGGSLGMLGVPPNFHCATRLSSLFKADVLLAVTSLLPKETGICKEINSHFPKATVLLKGRDQWRSAVLQGSLRASFHFLSKEFFTRC